MRVWAMSPLQLNDADVLVDQYFVRLGYRQAVVYGLDGQKQSKRPLYGVEFPLELHFVHGRGLSFSKVEGL